MAKNDDGRKIVADNRRARHEYAIEDVYEAGIALVGSEVKSLRAGRATIAESYASDEGGEIMLINATIPVYFEAGPYNNHEPKRPRKLLLKKKQIAKMLIAIQREGMTLVPLKIYFNERGRAKIELALAKGKKLHDKRDAEKKRDWARDKQRLLRDRG